MTANTREGQHLVGGLCKVQRSHLTQHPVRCRTTSAFTNAVIWHFLAVSVNMQSPGGQARMCCCRASSSHRRKGDIVLAGRENALSARSTRVRACAWCVARKCTSRGRIVVRQSAILTAASSRMWRRGRSNQGLTRIEQGQQTTRGKPGTSSSCRFKVKLKEISKTGG